jgi:hypothetical protein
MHYDSLMCSHILSKLDAFIDLTMTLKKLEYGLVTSLSKSTCMFLEELMKLFLLLGNILLCALYFI